nr:MAG TPA: hypothetical protein [Caudoviricetes sp.]DAU39446.1 MAG TPA: hypothetical protein [Caudoviricetes sp.]
MKSLYLKDLILWTMRSLILSEMLRYKVVFLQKQVLHYLIF